MTITASILILIMILLLTDEDVRLMLFFTLLMEWVDVLLWLTDNTYFFHRIAIQDTILAGLCIWFTLSNRTTNFIWAAIICLISASTMVYEGLHQYQSPIYHYLNNIQFVLMQLYLIALTYKANWRLPCPEQLKSLSQSRKISEQSHTTVQNECLQSDMEK